MTNKPNYGGIREGAGRKPAPEGAKRHTFICTEEEYRYMLEWIKTHREKLKIKKAATYQATAQE